MTTYLWMMTTKLVIIKTYLLTKEIISCDNIFSYLCHIFPNNFILLNKSSNNHYDTECTIISAYLELVHISEKRSISKYVHLVLTPLTKVYIPRLPVHLLLHIYQTKQPSIHWSINPLSYLPLNQSPALYEVYPG